MTKAISTKLRSGCRRVALRAREQAGAVATEYGLILTLVVLVTVIALTAYGASVSGLFDQGTAGFPSSTGS